MRELSCCEKLLGAYKTFESFRHACDCEWNPYQVTSVGIQRHPAHHHHHPSSLEIAPCPTTTKSAFRLYQIRSMSLGRPPSAPTIYFVASLCNTYHLEATSARVFVISTLPPPHQPWHQYQRWWERTRNRINQKKTTASVANLFAESSHENVCQMCRRCRQAHPEIEFRPISCKHQARKARACALNCWTSRWTAASGTCSHEISSPAKGFCNLSSAI